ncbi:MAG TPA: PIN domain-containing protein [Gracilimonas sp.]|uniref:PIN domain-containing protein n=1 Tax=Gracilimonas sp. TaxID=1974203 RepID=UPI002D9E85EC|nr:PIN domain-containing protein [Gracilimonas sp.]
MKVFTDTNFLVSALSTRGLSADIYQVILTEHEIMTGEFVLTELQYVLTTKLKVPAKIAHEAEQLPRKHYVEPTPDHLSEIHIRDENDRWVLESALRA